MLYIEEAQTTTYYFKWLDTSQLSLIDLGEYRVDYKVERQFNNYFWNENNKAAAMRTVLV